MGVGRRRAWVVGLACAAWAGVGGAAVGGQQQGGTPPKATLAVVGGFLIDGFGGPPRPNAVVLIDGDKIVAVGDEGRLAVPPGAKVIDANGFTVMPGLVDTHIHMDLIGYGNYDQWHPMVNAEYADVMQVAAAQLLKHGVTTARDAGGQLRASVTTRDRVNRGEIAGPRLLVSGDMIGTWSDAEWSRWYRNKISFNVHSVEEARQAARKLLDGGADCIKIRTPLTAEETKAVTDEAHARGKIVGMHIGNTEQEIRTAVEQGVDILDHVGSGRQNPLYSDDILRLLARTQRPITESSRVWTTYRELMAWPERMDDPELRKELGKYADPVLGSLKDVSALPYFAGAHRRYDPAAPSQLYKAGCRLIIGTDTGTPGNFNDRATVGQIEDYVNLVGMTPMEALIAGTKDAAAALRVNTGTIHAGRLADIILVKGNPLVDIRYLENVEHVIKGGVRQR